MAFSRSENRASDRPTNRNDAGEQAGQPWGRQIWRRHGGAVLRYFFRGDTSLSDLSTAVARAFSFRSTGLPMDSGPSTDVRSETLGGVSGLICPFREDPGTRRGCAGSGMLRHALDLSGAEDVRTRSSPGYISAFQTANITDCRTGQTIDAMNSARVCRIRHALR